MIFLLFPHKFRGKVIVGGGAGKFPVSDTHIRPHRAGIGRTCQRQGNPGQVGQKPGMKPHLRGKGMEGNITGMGGEDRQLLLPGQMLLIPDADQMVVADRCSREFNELKLMIETENVDEMRKMMRHSTERRALFDKK